MRRGHLVCGMGLCISVLVALGLIAPSCGDEAGNEARVRTVLIETPLGPVQGMAGDGVRVFRGIPYAEPPTGDLRWRPPQPRAAWTEPFDATVEPPWCPQLFEGGRIPEHPTSEDCLHVTVWTPDPPPNGDAPVMVFLHPGSFTVNGPTALTYSGERLTREGVILVAVGYRLGALGFLAHEALSNADPEHSASGNYGLMDQRFALEWVRGNITAFGGDPGNVTLFGVSAGSVSIILHLLLPESTALFHRGIAESSTPVPTYLTLAEAQELGAGFAEVVGCSAGDVLQCLRDTPVETLLQAQVDSTNYFTLITDGAFLPDDPINLLSNLRADRPLILGANENEAAMSLTDQQDLTAAEWQQWVEETWGDVEATTVAVSARPRTHPGNTPI